MSVNNKHLATLLLGAAAAFTAYKYSKMSEEEKEKIAKTLKDGFNKLRGEAEGSLDTAKNYFDTLKTKAADIFKEHFPDAEKHFNDFYKTGNNAGPSANAESGQQSGL